MDVVIILEVGCLVSVGAYFCDPDSINTSIKIIS